MQRKLKGNIGVALGALVLGIVVLFVGLFMITVVANAVNSSGTFTAASQFYTTYTGLISVTGTVFTIGGLVLTVAGLAMAIRALMDAFKAD